MKSIKNDKQWIVINNRQFLPYSELYKALYNNWPGKKDCYTVNRPLSSLKLLYGDAQELGQTKPLNINSEIWNQYVQYSYVTIVITCKLWIFC